MIIEGDPVYRVALFLILSSMLLNATGLSKSYGQTHVLSSLDIGIEEGRSLAVLGQSGSGKTTLLSILAGLEAPDTGNVRFHELDLYALPPDELTRARGRYMGIIFQEYHLVPSLTALENVALPLEITHDKHVHTRSHELLERVGLSHREDHYPHQLSGGEQQRVAIARALAASPKLLFADEPTGSLDEETAAGVEDLIFSLIRERGLTALIITHNQELSARCDQTLRLHLGRLA